MEIFLSGVWGSFFYDRFYNYMEAIIMVVCRQLGYSTRGTLFTVTKCYRSYLHVYMYKQEVLWLLRQWYIFFIMVPTRTTSK